MELAYYLVGILMGIIFSYLAVIVYVRYFGPISIDLVHVHEES